MSDPSIQSPTANRPGRSAMASLIYAVARKSPPWLIRLLGRLQFKIPVLGSLVRKVGKAATSGEGIIAYGVGKGLCFDATGGFPGYLLGTTEPLEQEVLKKALRPGAVYYDIGANIGFYSTLAARLVGADGRVFAFEPFPESALACKANADRNGFQNVTVVTAAVGAITGDAHLESGDSSALHRAQEQASTSSITVKKWALDDFVSETNAPPPNVVMIDVEGGEIDVLKGMQAVVAKSRPTILCEVHWLNEEFASYVKEALLPHGYVCTTYDGQPLPAENSRFHAILRPA